MELEQALRAGENLIAAAIQMTSTADKDHNLDTASRLVEEAAGRGASEVGRFTTTYPTTIRPAITAGAR